MQIELKWRQRIKSSRSNIRSTFLIFRCFNMDISYFFTCSWCELLAFATYMTAGKWNVGQRSFEWSMKLYFLVRYFCENGQTVMQVLCSSTLALSLSLSAYVPLCNLLRNSFSRGCVGLFVVFRFALHVPIFPFVTRNAETYNGCKETKKNAGLLSFRDHVLS